METYGMYVCNAKYVFTATAVTILGDHNDLEEVKHTFSSLLWALSSALAVEISL